MGGVRFTGTNATGTTIMATGRPSVGYGSFGRIHYNDDQNVLFVLRESSLSAHHELASLASTVLGRHDYREGLAELAAAGVLPLREPGRWGGERIPVPEGSMSLVQVGRSMIVYALTSAAKDSDGGANPFTHELARLIRTHRPHAVVTANMSRLVRHENHVSDLIKAFTQVKPILECTEKAINFRQTTAPSEFMELATHAIRDRAYIVTRMEDGRVAAATRGNYPFQGATLPIGYRRSHNRKVILGTAAQQAALKRAFVLLADRTVNDAQVASVLVASKAFRAGKAGKGGTERQPLSQKLAEAWVGRLVERVDTWANGIHVMTQTVNGVSLDLDLSDAMDGPVAAVYEFVLPLPEGGWASEEVFAAVRERGRKAQLKKHRSKNASPDKHEYQMPLGGYSWRVGSTEFRFESRKYGATWEKARYALFQRPAAADAEQSTPGDRSWDHSLSRGWGTTKVTSDSFVCMVPARALHRSIAAQLGSMNSFEFEASARVLNDFGSRSAPHDTSADELAALEVELAGARVMKQRARALIYSPEADESMSAEFHADYREAVESITRLNGRITAVRDREAPAQLDEPFAVSAGSFLSALAHLHEVEGPLPREVVKALHAVLSEFTVDYDKKRGEAVWSLRLRLLTQEAPGERLTQRLTARLPVIPARRSPASLAHREELALRYYMESEAVSPDQHGYAIEGLHRRGIVGRGAAHMLLSAPLDVRSHVISALLDEGRESQADATYVSLAVAAYRNSSGVRGRWNSASERRQKVLDIVTSEGPVLRADLWSRGGGGDTERSFDHHIREADGSWLGATVVERLFVGASKSGGQRVRVTCRTCPHCGGKVDIVARVPECPAGLLCSACLRMPTPGSPEFPDCYRSLAARPQARRYVESAEQAWWNDLRRAHDAYPSSPLTTLATSLGRPRHEVKAACEAMGLAVKSVGKIAPEWTDERLRVEYIDRDRRLEDLAFELAVSTGTLSKRLRSAGISKYARHARSA